MKQTSNLMVAMFDQVVCVKVCGKADFSSSLDLKRLINELWQRGYNRFVFELCDCVTMDSTFLGMLSGIGLKFCDGNMSTGSPLELFNPSPRIAEVLDSLGVAHLFKITRSENPLSYNFEPLAKSTDTTRAEVTRNCLEAHQTLMDIKPENVNKFKDVAQFLAEDLKRLETTEKKKTDQALPPKLT
jgi:anti-sigma B factor antagonist